MKKQIVSLWLVPDWVALGWEIVGYSKFDCFGIPKYADIEKKI